MTIIIDIVVAITRVTYSYRLNTYRILNLNKMNKQLRNIRS